jgi:tetratricopeptide (TPR) repeat protein
VARLAPQVPDVDFASGLLATGVLWPVREPVQEFDGDAIDAIRAIAGPQGKHVLRVVQAWDDNPLAAARALSALAQDNLDLAEALAALVAHFDAANVLSAHLGAMPPEVGNQIKAALVNIGGIINIHSLTLNVTPTVEIPPPPRPDGPPEIDEFVGRSRELAYYAAMLTAHHLAVISGMAGVGKTALAATLAHQTSQADHIFWHSFREREGIEVIVWKLAAFLAWHGQEDLWRMLQSARQTGGQPPPPETLFDYLLQMVEGRTYLLCFDDLHLVEDDPLLVRLMERLRAALVAGRLSLVITARRIPSFVQTVQADILAGMNAEDARLLLIRWGLPLPEPLFDRLYARTGGNAQFMTLAMNVLHQEADPTSAIDRLVESDNVERYLLAEVDEGLTEQEQAVMGAVAVFLGYPGTQDAVEAVLDGESVGRTLRQLTDRHLLMVREGTQGREYQQHAMVQVFYYDLLSRARRRTMHVRAATFYETDEPDMLRSAIHHEQGGNYARSVQLATQNLWAMINQGQMRSLRLLLEQFSAAQLEPVDWFHVNLALGQICHVLAEGQRARHHYQEALDRFESMDGGQEISSLRAKVYRGLGQLDYNERPHEALGWLQRAFDELARTGGQIDQQLEASLYLDMGWAHRRLHNVSEAMEAFQRGLERLPAEPNPLRGDALTRLVALYVAQFDLENAQHYAQLAVENSRHLRDVWNEQRVLAMLGNIKHLACDWKGAVKDYEGALALALKVSDRAVQTAMEVNLGVVHANLGNAELALEHLTNGLRLSQQSNLRNYALKAELAVAKLYIRLRNWDGAESHLIAAEQLVESAGSADAQFHLPLILSTRAELRLQTGNIEDAMTIAEKSIALAIEQDKHVDLAICRRIKGQILMVRGEYHQAQALLAQSLPPLSNKHRFETAKTKVLLGYSYRKTGDLVRGDELVEEARTIFTAVDAKFELADLARHTTITAVQS